MHTKKDIINRIKQELKLIRDVPLYLKNYKFPEIVDEIEKKLIDKLTKKSS